MRVSPIPERERAICARLREARLETRLSQVAFCRDAGIDSSLLASYEHARVPLRYQLADRFCNLMNLSQRWLAHGIDQTTRHYYVPVKPTVQVQIPSRM